MEQQDDWLEGVRRWYFGGEAPEGAERDEQIVWPGSSSAPSTPSAAGQRPDALGPAPHATVAGTGPVDRVQWVPAARAGRPLAEPACCQACLR